MNKPYLQKAAGFCAYQERTQAEVRERLYEWGIRGDDTEEMISWLIENNYINEERFAVAFAGGRFRLKQWGKVRIKQELQLRGLSSYCIQKAMEEIQDADYEATLQKLVNKKIDEFDIDNPFIKKQKIARYLIGKGYEAELVWKQLS